MARLPFPRPADGALPLALRPRAPTTTLLGAGPLVRAQVRLAGNPDPRAARAWAAHVAAGRIAAPVAPPPAPPGAGRDYGLASLARILGRPA